MRNFKLKNKDNYMKKIRVGMGYDVHQLVNDRELWLGGVKI